MKKKLFQPLQTKRSFEEVSLEIKKMIFTGQLKPGDRLPSEVEMARQFEISRNTLREALRMLEYSGFITISRGGNGGPVVSNKVLDAISNLYLDAFQINEISFQNLTTARLEIENIVMKYAIQNADAADFDLLLKNIEQGREKIAKGQLATKENIEFHNGIAKASKNPIFMIVMKTVMATVDELTARIMNHYYLERDIDPFQEDILKSQNAVHHHELIVQAMIEKNEEKALGYLQEHLMELQGRMKLFEEVITPRPHQ